MKGVLLSNLGSPDSPTPKALKAYLKQFLMDPYVIDVFFPLRYALVNWLIVPKRSHESAEAYSKIWTNEGSPLVSFTEKLCKKVSELIGSTAIVDFAMRYGAPSLESTLAGMKHQGVDDLFVMPLYPQHAWATNVSTEVEVRRILKKLNYQGKVSFLEAFYQDPSYIKASAEVYARQLKMHQPFDHYLFSYHGIPERHLKYTDPTKNHCLSSKDCCATACTSNKQCYKHHCTVNTELVSKALGLPKQRVSISFQSRLGKDPWLKPFTDFEFERLAKQGVKRLAVFCPSFVADCLETLEEIGMRGQQDFKSFGGEELVMITSLNHSDEWVQCVQNWSKNFIDKAVI